MPPKLRPTRPARTFLTEAGLRMCREASAETDTCLLSFSRGKDSIAAWLVLREFFTVVPFHMSGVPGLSFVNRSLDYYEHFFGTKIRRFVNGEIPHALHQLWFQPPWEVARVDSSGVWPSNYSYKHLFGLLREELGCPNAWAATGERITDNTYTGGKLKRTGGVYRDLRILHPVFDWDDERILSLLREYRVKLPPDYRLSYRSLHDMPTALHLYGIRTHFPADYNRIRRAFPLIEAQIARNEFRKFHRGVPVDPSVGITPIGEFLNAAPGNNPRRKNPGTPVPGKRAGGVRRSSHS